MHIGQIRQWETAGWAGLALACRMRGSEIRGVSSRPGLSWPSHLRGFVRGRPGLWWRSDARASRSRGRGVLRECEVVSESGGGKVENGACDAVLQVCVNSRCRGPGVTAHPRWVRCEVGEGFPILASRWGRTCMGGQTRGGHTCD